MTTNKTSILSMDQNEVLPAEDFIQQEVERRILAELKARRRRHFDFCLIHSEEDLEEVAKFRDKFCKEHNLIGLMESDEDMCSITNEFDRIEEMLNRSSKIFLFITEHFVEDKMCRMQKNELLAQHIRLSRQNIVPIYLEKYLPKLPFGLTGMVGFKMYLGDGDRKRVCSTFSDTVRKERTEREASEERMCYQTVAELRPRILRQVQAEYRHWQRRNENNSGACTAENVVAVQSTNYTQIQTAGSVVNGPVFNITLHPGATVNLDPVSNNHVNIQRLGDDPNDNQDSGSDEASSASE